MSNPFGYMKPLTEEEQRREDEEMERAREWAAERDAYIKEVVCYWCGFIFVCDTLLDDSRLCADCRQEGEV